MLFVMDFHKALEPLAFPFTLKGAAHLRPPIH